jgi:hypothetical protein
MTRYLTQVLTTTLASTGFGRLSSFPRWAIVALIAAQASFAPKAAKAGEAGEGNPPPAAMSPAATFIVDARLGPALLLRSQSHAVGHLLKPDLRLGVRLAWKDRWEFGAAVDTLLDGSEHYRILGLMGHARFAAIQLGFFSLGLSGAIGAGYDADILHSSLQAGGRVAPYYFVALDGRWRVGRFLIGAEGACQNLAVLQAGLLVGFRFSD